MHKGYHVIPGQSALCHPGKLAGGPGCFGDPGSK